MKDVMQLLPELSAMREALKAMEKQLYNQFGYDLHLSIQECSADLVIDAFAKIVSDTLSIPVKEIFGFDRKQDVVDARHIAIYLVHQKAPSLQLIQIGRYFDKDHTTVIHARQKVTALLDSNDVAFTCKFNQCKQAVEARINKTE